MPSLKAIPPDVPAPRRKCEGLSPGTPCPAYFDGSWPEGCDCVRWFDRDEDGYDSATIWVACALAVVALVAMTLFAFGADSNCLTREEARKKYPTSYLYWRTAARCWYARDPGRGNPSQSQSRSVRPPSVKVVRELEFNELDAQADRGTYFSEQLVWRLVPIPQPRFKLWDERIGM